MTVEIPHSLRLERHELWQTAASPFIIPTQWQSMYKKCPKCGGNAPNTCDDVWPQNWWEDDMLALMYQGHIPPSQRTAPWDEYYAGCRVESVPAVTAQPILHVNTQYYGYQAQQPITPPNTPGVSRHAPYHPNPRPTTPVSPTLQYSRQGRLGTMPFDNPYGITAQMIDLSTFP